VLLFEPAQGIISGVSRLDCRFLHQIEPYCHLELTRLLREKTIIDHHLISISYSQPQMEKLGQNDLELNTFAAHKRIGDSSGARRQQVQTGEIISTARCDIDGERR
jgi:hypothetical protein